jgi:hypothetical protein
MESWKRLRMGVRTTKEGDKEGKCEGWRTRRGDQFSSVQFSSAELCAAPSSLWCVRSRELSWDLGSDSNMPWGKGGRSGMR